MRNRGINTDSLYHEYPYILVGCCVLAALTVFTDATTLCYNCYHVAHPRDCDRVVQCGDEEKCHVVAYAQPDGNYYYNVGCLKQASCPSIAIGRRDLAICDRCCDGHYCNKELCDGPPPTEHGPRCLKCETVEHPSQCGAVTECAIGEVCFTREKYVFGERRYQLGCASNTCTPRSSKRSIFERQAGSCLKCCNTENCNRDQCTNTGAPLTQAPVTVPSKHPTTATTKPVTQKPGQPTHVYNLHGCHYHGKVYQAGQTWDEGCDFRCTCINSTTGRYNCQDICPTYVHVPDTCHLEKPPGECCSHPVCKGSNVTSTNFTSSTLINECFYKGKHYKQGATWRDGCQWECTCTNGTTGFYRCHSRCYQWNLPPKCHLNQPAPGKCCQTPSCPAGYLIKYPPGYVEN